jgi:hypothetical protein
VLQKRLDARPCSGCARAKLRKCHERVSAHIFICEQFDQRGEDAMISIWRGSERIVVGRTKSWNW